MISNYTKIYNQVKNWMQDNSYPNQQQLIALINAFEMIPGNEQLSIVEKNSMLKEFEEMFAITIQTGTQLTKQGWQPWMHTRNEEQKIEFYTKRYKNHLVKHTDMPKSVINEIFNSTDKILECMANPFQNDGFKKKGLVVGHVQSGKTANYIALINKAADVGYKLIILIAGVHNNLRTQTQKRVNEGFIGFDSLKRESIGVGIGLDGDISKRPISFTNTESDFKKTILKQQTFDPTNSNVPVVLVIKKNSSTLKNILSWLETSKDKDTFIKNYPMLLIDDEADNASINTKKKPNEATTINKQIRQILNMFFKVSYVGFTATPFANIFIDPDAEHEEYKDDLFPDDFIISLETPSNYFGAKKVFLEESEKYLKTITDNDFVFPVPLPRDFTIVEMPESFYESLYLFVLSIGIKKLRGIKNPHSSMLVNVTHKNDFQAEVKNIIQEELTNLLNVIKFNYKKSLSDAIKNSKIAKLFKLSQDEYKNKDSFIDILNEIVKLELQIKTLLINSKSKEQLNYDEYKDDGGLHVIAVGGYSLSRGFTLEGLTISYFLRNTAMYDTLLQMGRWFGYRDNYDDICRVYLREESINWYSHIADATEEVRNEFEIMQRNQMSPRDFGLKVRKHPDSLLITARNKMISGQDIIGELSYSSGKFETNKLSKNKSIVQKNFYSLSKFIDVLNEQKKYQNGINIGNRVWKDIGFNLVLGFVNNFEVDESDDKFYELMKEYLVLEAEDSLNNWDVALVSNDLTKNIININDLKIGKQSRKIQNNLNSKFYNVSGGGNRIIRQWDEAEGLNDIIDKIKIEANIDDIKRIKTSYFRENRSKPLLALTVLSVMEDEQEPVDMVAFGISFPKSKTQKNVEYKVNKVWVEKYFGTEEDDEERDDE